MEPYRQTVDDVLAAFGTDAIRLEPKSGAGAARTLRPERTDSGSAGAGMAEVSRPVHGRARDPADRRGGDFRRAVALRARRRVALRSDRDLRHRAAQRAHGLLSSRRARSRRWRRCARCRRRTPTSSATASRQSVPAAELVPGRHHPRRGRRHHSRRRAADPVDRAADRRSGADRREPAGVEGHRSDRGEAGTRRPAQHDLQRHGGDLRPRARGGHGDRHADRDGAHRRHAERGARTRPRRCKRSSTASASCSASSSSSSPW